LGTFAYLILKYQGDPVFPEMIHIGIDPYAFEFHLKTHQVSRSISDFIRERIYLDNPGIKAEYEQALGNSPSSRTIRDSFWFNTIFEWAGERRIIGLMSLAVKSHNSKIGER
jgi:hypothetical protein